MGALCCKQANSIENIQQEKLLWSTLSFAEKLTPYEKLIVDVGLEFQRQGREVEAIAAFKCAIKLHSIGSKMGSKANTDRFQHELEAKLAECHYNPNSLEEKRYFHDPQQKPYDNECTIDPKDALSKEVFALTKIAEHYKNLKRDVEASAALRCALVIQKEKTDCPNDFMIQIVLQRKLAECLCETGLISEAYEEIQQVLSGYREALGEESIETRETLLMCKEYALFSGLKEFEGEAMNGSLLLKMQNQLDSERNAQNNILRSSIYSGMLDDVIKIGPQTSMRLLESV